MTIEKLFSKLPPDHIEYHRNALALIPPADDPDPGVVLFFVDDYNGGKHTLNCGCECSANGKKCAHIKKLSHALRKTPGFLEEGRFDVIFRGSIWHRLAEILHKACPVSPGNFQVDEHKNQLSENSGIRLSELKSDTHIDCFFKSTKRNGHNTDLLLERTGVLPSNGNQRHRGWVLDILSKITLSPNEREMYKRGFPSRRMDAEIGFWYRLMYHCYNVVSDEGVALTMDIAKDTGRFMVRCRGKDSSGIDIAVPRGVAMQVKRILEKELDQKSFLPIWPDSLESIVNVYIDGHNDLKLSLYLLLHFPDGSTKAFERRSLSRYWYGNMVYIPDQQVLASLRQPDKYWPIFKGKYTKKIKPDRIPDILEQLGDIFSPPNIVDENIDRLKIYKAYSRVEIEPEAMDREWCWLAVYYGFGENVRVSLSDLFQARQSGKRYIRVDDGWVDTHAVKVTALTAMPGSAISGQLVKGGKTIKLSRMELLHLQASLNKPIEVPTESENSRHQMLKSILEMRLSDPVGDIPGMASSLRLYQHKGVEWLAFLHENKLGGLLCDEMGLGKTHQVMALMAWLVHSGKNKKPAIVVCPTTVISHWARKIKDHAPGLKPLVYHGSDRTMPEAGLPGSILITSYGLLLRDIDALSRIRFGVAAFDEAQHLKNNVTKSYQAAKTIDADLKIAVTGTPVENRLTDLKALMDLVLPGYLGSDQGFQQRYETGNKMQVTELRRLIRPFALRRTKAVVLDELPEKIEDIRYCSMTESQVKLYRQAIDGRGRKLMAQIRQSEGDIPYIHIFALLTILKQICNHPATVGQGVDSAAFESGKWDLFTELVDSCLENEEKIVVFSQFLPMIQMILAYMKQKGIETASITGNTRNRGKEIERFNVDPNCRVFVGSLKAGGSGIDLTGGSVVIHYDRWWNAAKEDQATDRVHRIGQTRGVQVFKLVTEGTLEEKIAAIIDRKKNLMGDVIQDDDPGVLKTFSRDELMDLMAMPE